MLSQIAAVLRQARVTFTSGRDLLYQNIEILKAVLDKTTSDDINLDPKFKSEDIWNAPHKAPVTYIDIYEDENLTIGVFVLKPGMKLPLHDHPDMHGLIKVISGKIKVKSYTVVEKEPETNFSLFDMPSQYSLLKSNVIEAEKLDDIILDENSESCILEPLVGNLHEIESIGGPAAFIDILAPPYDTVIPSVGTRNCNYYSVLSHVSSKIYKLSKVSSPHWYWTDSCRYAGPELPREFTH